MLTRRVVLRRTRLLEARPLLSNITNLNCRCMATYNLHNSLNIATQLFKYNKMLTICNSGITYTAARIQHMEAFSRSGPPPSVAEASAKASPILGSTPRLPSNQRTIASWDHLTPEANQPVLTCQCLQPRHHTR
jgi:hypothetical protein